MGGAERGEVPNAPRVATDLVLCQQQRNIPGAEGTGTDGGGNGGGRSNIEPPVGGSGGDTAELAGGLRCHRL